MPKQPRRPRAIKRATDAKPERVASRIITPALISAKLASSTCPRHGSRPPSPRSCGKRLRSELAA